MIHFNNSMTSAEARKVFFDLKQKMLNDEISIEEFSEIITEYKDISEEITNREMEEWRQEIEDSTIRLTEDTM